MNEVTHIFIVLLLVVLMYYAWMDVALYYKLQSQTDNLLLTQNYIEDRSNAKYQNILLLLAFFDIYSFCQNFLKMCEKDYLFIYYKDFLKFTQISCRGNVKLKCLST